METITIKEYKLFRNEDRHPYLRVKEEFEYETDIFSDSYNIATLMVELYNMNELFIEYSYVLGFNYSNKLLGIIELGHQTDNEALTPIKEMFISLLLMGANNFVLVHNHPGNNLKASAQDENLANKIKLCENLLGITFRDSIIITDEDFLSLKNEGVI